ncbi:MAG: GNAT family N-acetyltransferase [Myxococcaceae bacterium]|nr:GNAT family N-acetyltransferase [Myxococcaceae bacterium]
MLRRLRIEALTEAPEAFSSTLAREKARTEADWRRWLSPGITLLLEEAGVARGLVAGALDRDDAHIAHLMAMWIDPALRGSGTADLLVQAHFDWARSAGARVVRLGVIDTNARARRLYERHGFRVTGPGPFSADGRREIHMERPLDEATGLSGEELP